MRLPDPDTSRAVLVGTSTYAAGSGFASLPSVATNLERFRQLLCEETGLGRRHVHPTPDPADQLAILHALRPAVDDARDLLLFYFSGHGVALPDHDLGLTHSGSQAADPAWSTVNYRLIRDEILRSRAKVKLVILDCCHSGNAFAAGTLAGVGDSEALKDIAAIDGSYVLTATSRKMKFAWASGPNGCTAFTGFLLDVLRSGSASCGEYLTMDSVFPLLRAKLVAANLPAPQASGRNTAAAMALARNKFRMQPGTGEREAVDLGWSAVQRNDLDEAEKWFRLGAETADAPAMNSLGWLLRKRGGLAEAEHWFRKAADLGDVRAMNNLGALLAERGELSEAERWYRKAAESLAS